MKLEPYLPDARVLPVQDKLYGEYPVLKEYGTDFATGRIEPPWHGVLPDGRTGWTQHPVVQFIVVSDHPRPIQKRMGVRHATVGTVWPAAFEQSEKEGSHYVIGENSMSAEERIFRAVLHRHLWEMERLSRIQTDATEHPSGIKSALEAL